MLSKILSTYIRQALPFVPNQGQEELIAKLGNFLTGSVASSQPSSGRSMAYLSSGPSCFILRGYAGTGKTSMVAALVKSFARLNLPCVLLAPTGRAAKVLAAYSGKAAYTIHKKIYRQRQMGMEQFAITDNLHSHTLFIVDEASMLSGQKQYDSPFGSGNLMQDLFQYVYSGNHCSLLLLGDTAQLPPVGSSESPALNPDIIASYLSRIAANKPAFSDAQLSSSQPAYNLYEHTLTEVARQALDSGILRNATAIRTSLEEFSILQPLITPFPDIRHLSANEFLETLEDSYRIVGQEETILLTRTNRRTNLYNQTIRNRILWYEDELSGGDRLMVTKNNYFWTEEYEQLDFLANGDMFDVVRLRNEREMYGFTFVDASLKAVDYDYEIDVVLWLDTFFTDSPEANYELQKTLFSRIAEDYPEIRNKKELFKTIMQSPYYNALQARFAYAVTCHKAQGGQWKHVYIDPGMLDEETTAQPDFLRWLYTALTRAREQIYLIGFPDAEP